MTRDQMKTILGDAATDEVVTKLLDAMHGEIQPYKDAAKKAQDDLAAKVAEMETISKKAASVDEMTKAINDLRAKYDADVKAANERAAALEFDGMIDGKLREKGARNIKAARALLDMDSIRTSKNQQSDAEAAIDALTKAQDSAFLFGAHPTGEKISIGAPTGNSSGGMTREDIKKIKDPEERQKAIAANLNLYQTNK